MSVVDVRTLPPLSLARMCRVRVALRNVTDDDIAAEILAADRENEIRAAKRGSRRAGLGLTPRCGGCHRFMAYGTSLHTCGYDQHRGWLG